MQNIYGNSKIGTVDFDKHLYTLPSQIPKLNMEMVSYTSNDSPLPTPTREDYASKSQQSDGQPISVRSNAPYEEIEKIRSETSSNNNHKDVLEQWNRVENLRTLFGWITISALNIECLNEAIMRYRKFIAYGTIMGLLFSTAAGTISSTQFNTSNVRVYFGLNVLFTFFSFMIAVYTGILKTLQIQERLEDFIKIKQEWILFSATISSELQLPIHLRTPILHIIKNYKNKFLDLLKTDLEIPEFIKNDIIRQIKLKEEQKYKNKKWDDLKYTESSSLSDVIMEIGSQELKRLLTQYDENFHRHHREKHKSSHHSHGGDRDKHGLNKSVRNFSINNSIQRELDNIYRQFALINKNVDSMNSSVLNKRKRGKNDTKNISPPQSGRRATHQSSNDIDIESGESVENSSNSSESKKNNEAITRHYSFLNLNNQNNNFQSMSDQINILREEQKKLNNLLKMKQNIDNKVRKSITDNINSVSDVYKNIMDGSIAQKILDSEKNTIDEYYLDEIPNYEGINLNAANLYAASVAASAAAEESAAASQNIENSDSDNKSSLFPSDLSSPSNPSNNTQ